MSKKHPCKDCFSCQECAESRCRLCRKSAACGCKLSIREQIRLYEELNLNNKVKPEIKQTEELR